MLYKCTLMGGLMAFHKKPCLFGVIRCVRGRSQDCALIIVHWFIRIFLPVEDDQVLETMKSPFVVLTW